MFQQIRQLIDLINQSVDTLERACNETGTQLPSPYEPFDPATEAFRANPVAEKAACLISAAALQLDVMVAPAQSTLSRILGGHRNSSAIRVCLESNVTEILREAGPEGLHVNGIAAKNGLDAQKLARCLRLLATHHVYREVEPDIFANTRSSSLLDTLKSSDEILADPEHKYDDTNGVAAVISHTLDDQFKSSPYLWEAVNDPKTAKSGEATDSPFARAVGNGKAFWEWLEQPENDFKQRRFNIGMRGTHWQAIQATKTIISAFDWNSLPAKSIVVDVGGGIGSASMTLAKEFSHLSFVIQDRSPVIETGIEVWKKEMSNSLSSGQVKFEAHDFFGSQPQTNASVFFLKNVLHDWSDIYCSKILKQLRDVATPNTKLICVEVIVPYACHDPSDDSGGGIPGTKYQEAPNPLLANWGAVNESVYLFDVAMMTLVNAQERTIGQFERLFKSAGWQITAIRRHDSVDVSFPSSLEAAPITY